MTRLPFAEVAALMTKLVHLTLCLPLLGLPMVGGCVGKDGDANIEASASSHRSKDDDGGAREPRRQCENTSIGGEPKSFCY